ncbi:MAG: serine/threonine protein kinase [Deltaproteobacteria bacterium]|nr:serine/threonine protein kinase [Deltaproteobacteria bacterium]
MAKKSTKKTTAKKAPKKRATSDTALASTWAGSAPTQDPRIGTLLDGRYTIRERLAAGGMGVVYRAERVQIGQRVAIKFLNAPAGDEKTFIARFEVEARAMSRLEHPNCVSIIDFGIADTPYLVMDFVTGRTVAELIDAGPVPIGRTVGIMHQLLAGLSHAHKKEIVHRDIKPANLIITEGVAGTGDYLRILDFGLAKLRQDGVSIDGTADNAALGTPIYMAPEQVTGGAVDARCDLYAAGLVLFELLTGRRAFSGRNKVEVLCKKVDQDLPLLRELAAHRSQAMEKVLARAVARDPEQRFASAAAFADALAQTPEAITARQARSPKTALAQTVAVPQLRRRRRRIASVGLLLCIAGALASWVKFSPAGQSSLRRLLGGVPAHKSINAQPTTSERRHQGRQAKRVKRPVAGREPDAPTAAARHRSAGVRELSAKPAPKPAKRSDAPRNESHPSKAVAQVAALIRQQRYNSARRLLSGLRKRSPKNAYLAFLSGQADCGQLRFGAAMRNFGEALAIDRKYRRSSTISREAVRALGSSAHRKAAYLILKHLRLNALPQLRRAAKRHPNKRVRIKASYLAKRIAGA